MCSVMSTTFTPARGPRLPCWAMPPPEREECLLSIYAVYRTLRARQTRHSVSSRAHARRCPRSIHRARAHARGSAHLHGSLERASAASRLLPFRHAHRHRLALVEATRHVVGPAAAGRARLRAGLSLLCVSRDGAPDGVPQPVAERGRRHADRSPHLLAVPQLPRILLGASPLHAGPRA